MAIEYSRADEKRGYDFAVRLKRVFEDSGFDVWGYMPAFTQASGDPIKGLQVAVKKDNPSDIVGGAIQQAFAKVGIEVQGVINPNNNYEDDRAVVFVGIKP